MSAEKWLLVEGKVHKLVDIVTSRKEAENLAQVLEDNCYIVISEIENGRIGVYWRPRTGVISPHGVV